MTRRLGLWTALVLGVGCGGSQTQAHPAVPAPVWVCSEGYEKPTSAPTPEVLHKLEGLLAVRVQQPRDACERIVVSVTYRGERAALVSAGLQTGFDQDGVVSGIIEVRRVLTLAALPEVLRIEMQPEVHLD